MITALSGHTPKQLSHEKRLPHESGALEEAFDSSRPPTTSSNVDCGARRRLRPHRPRRIRVVPGVQPGELSWLVLQAVVAARRSQASMLRAAFFPCPTATVTVRSAGTISPPAKMPSWPVIRSVPTWAFDTVVDLETGDAVEEREIGLLPEGEHGRVDLGLLELAGQLQEAGLVELHPLDDQLPLVRPLDRREPLHQYALAPPPRPRSRGRACGRPAVDDDLHPAPRRRRPRCVDGRVCRRRRRRDGQRLLLALHAAEERDGIEDVRSGAAGM